MFDNFTGFSVRCFIEEFLLFPARMLNSRSFAVVKSSSLFNTQLGAFHHKFKWARIWLRIQTRISF